MGDSLRGSFPPGFGELPELSRVRGIFVDGTLEEAFQREAYPTTRRYTRFSVTLSVIVFLAYGVHDWLVVPEAEVFAWTIRYGFFLPVSIGLLFFVFKNRHWWRHQRAMLVFGMAVNTVVLSIAAHAQTAGYFIYTGFALVFVTLGPFIARMNVRMQIVYTLATVALYLALDWSTSHASLVIRFSTVLTFVTLGAIGTLAAREVEIQARIAFVQRQVIRDQMAALDAERHRSESLLLNVLPSRIAELLKTSPGVTIAERFESATVLFADIVGFTELSSRLPAEELVRKLDEIFTKLDDLADRFGLEKIKTIGDAYMVAGGIPKRRADHAAAVCDMALGIREAVAALAESSNEKIGVRIGIHTGPVVAGVIGKKKFIYDVWGDSVNVASRMESHGVPGAIQVSEATYEATSDAFDYDERGAITVKGKGEMQTYLLLRRRPVSGGRVASLPRMPTSP